MEKGSNPRGFDSKISLYCSKRDFILFLKKDEMRYNI